MDLIDREKLEQIMAECADFFEVEGIPEPNIVFIHSREDMDKALGWKTPPWVCANTSPEGLYFIHESKLEDLTPHSKETFWPVVKHEVVHWTVDNMIGDTDGKPRWFQEGLAEVISKGKYDKPRPLDTPVIDKYYSETEEDTYSWGPLMVQYLLNGYGREKLITLVKSLAGEKMTKKFFAMQFESIYHFDVALIQNKAAQNEANDHAEG